MTPPDKITGVTATDAGDGTINVSWTASSVADFAKYRIYILSTSKTNVTSDTYVEVAGVTMVNYEATGYSAGSTYFVYVTAVDSNGNEITNSLTPTSVSLAEAEEPEDGGLSSTAIAGIVVGIVLVVIVVALVLMRKKKGSEPV